MNNKQTKTWWYGFDPNTFKYAGMRLSVEKPDNATDVSFDDISNPTWNAEKNVWEGDSIEDELAKLRARAEADEASEEIPMADLVGTVASLQEKTDESITALMEQVATLQAQLTTPSSSNS